MNIEIKDGYYFIKFNYDPALVEFCKTLQNARYLGETKTWRVARNVPNAIDLTKHGFRDEQMLVQRPKEWDAYPWLRPQDWSVSAEFYRHQQEWATWAKSKDRLMLVAEMGLGKTLMSIQWLQSLRVPEDEILVVCPVSLINHWQQELKQFAGINAHCVQGSTTRRTKALAETGVHIINYEYMTLNEKVRKALDRKCVVILDESHKLKHSNTSRSKVFHEYCKSRLAVLLLTGTPISQGAQDYYSQFKCLNAGLLGHSFTSFKHRYCIEEPIYGAPIGASRIIGYKNLDELTRLTAPYIFTLRKKDCLDLPEKVYETRHVELSDEQRKSYNALKYNMATYLSSGAEVTAGNVLTRLIRFSQVTQGFLASDSGVLERYKSNPKIKCLEEIIDDFLPGEQFIVMCRFLDDIKNVTEKLTELGISCCSITGSVPPADRQDIVQGFKQGKSRALVGQIRVLGVGFNIETCKKMVFFSNEYSHVDRVQAEDRIHRATSTGDSCVYIDIVASDTVDEHIVRALKSKKDVADMLTELRIHFNT